MRAAVARALNFWLDAAPDASGTLRWWQDLL